MNVSDDDYISAGDAADLLGVTERQVNRYGLGDPPKLRTRRNGRRVFYLRSDVLALSETLNAGRPRPGPRPKTEVMPVGQVLDYLREKDAALAQRERELLQLAAELGAVKQELGNKAALIDHANTQQQRLETAIEELRAERDELKRRLEEAQQQRPWWKRLLG
jgi:hypothetical protein